MRRIRWTFRIVALALHMAILSLRVKAVVGPYFPYIRFVMVERRTLRKLWQEWQAIQNNI